MNFKTVMIIYMMMILFNILEFTLNFIVFKNSSILYMKTIHHYIEIYNFKNSLMLWIYI